MDCGTPAGVVVHEAVPAFVLHASMADVQTTEMLSCDLSGCPQRPHTFRADILVLRPWAGSPNGSPWRGPLGGPSVPPEQRPWELYDLTHEDDGDRGRHASRGTQGGPLGGRRSIPMMARLLVNGSVVGESQVLMAGSGGTLDVGSDLVSTVSPNYASPCAFTGKIVSVTIDLRDGTRTRGPASFRCVLVQRVSLCLTPRCSRCAWLRQPLHFQVVLPDERPDF
jgi:hypothetical protein